MKKKEIKDFLGIENNKYTPYRDRLIKRGLINGDEHGYVRFVLPMFEDYVLINGDENQGNADVSHS